MRAPAFNGTEDLFMGNASQSDVTRLLNEPREPGQPSEALLTLVYEQLRGIAQQRMRGERAGHTLEATALVHEAWLRLLGGADVRWEGRAHFFAAAAEAMRRILVERARRRSAARHGGGRRQVSLDEGAIAGPDRQFEVIAVSEALEKLAAEDSQYISHATAERYWAYSRLKLYEWLKGPETDKGNSRKASGA
jgi:RNA polymerase sigma factor (TIGR02999 family)